MGDNSDDVRRQVELGASAYLDGLGITMSDAVWDEFCRLSFQIREGHANAMAIIDGARKASARAERAEARKQSHAQEPSLFVRAPRKQKTGETICET